MVEHQAVTREVVSSTPAGPTLRVFKDGAYYCYCAYVLRISRYLDFLSPMLTNSGIFLRGLRTVPTIVIAHTFCASRDTRISYR